MSVRLIYQEAGLVLAEIGPVCVAIWRDDSNLPRVERQRQALTEVVASHRGEAGFLCVVEPTSAPPSEEARSMSSKMFEQQGSDLRGVAVVIEGSGFRASIVRSVASSIVFLARNRSKTPVSYFASVDAGVGWLQQQQVPVGARPLFVRDVEELRARLKPKAQ